MQEPEEAARLGRNSGGYRRRQRLGQVGPVIDPGKLAADQGDGGAIRRDDRQRQRDASLGGRELNRDVGGQRVGRSPFEKPFHRPAAAGRLEPPDLPHGAPGNEGRLGCDLAQAEALRQFRPAVGHHGPNLLRRPGNPAEAV